MRCHYTPARAWEPLSEKEWAALAPFIRRQGPGRPVRDPRARLDACFRAATSGEAWARIEASPFRPDTVHRQFRRWAHAGLWTRLLRAVARRRPPTVLRRLAHWICRAYRRALRLLGLAGIVLARRLGLLSALPGPPWMLPDPDLSATVFRALGRALQRLREELGEPWPRPSILRARRALLRRYRRVLGIVAGRRWIPRCLAPA